jgi:hypothetical protein
MTWPHLAWAGGRTIRVAGVPPGARWWLAAAGAEAAPCTPVGAGLCVNLASPGLIAQGTGPATVTLPARASGFLQAVALVRGEA